MTNRPALEINEGKFVMDRYLSPNFHTSKFENRKVLFPALKDYVTFPEVVPDINKEVLRWVYTNLLVACERCPQGEEHHQ